MVKTQKNPLSYLAKEEEIYWSVKKIVEKTVKDKTQYKILDVGCGLGYLTYCLRQDSYNAIGIDISAKAIVQATERFGDFYKRMDIFDPSPDAEMRFDIIILTEVIEHINNPILFLEQLIKYLNDNGKIIVTTPNKSASSKQCVWDTDLPPIHQWWFTKKSLRFMGQNLHLGVRFINFSGFYFKKFQSLKKTTAICDKNSITSHLDKNGELIIKTETLKQTSIVRGVLSKIFPLKFIYKFFVRFINWIQYMRSGEGRIVCAVFEKQ